MPLQLNDFTIFFFSIIVEAFPFVLLGVLVSVFVGIFVDENWLYKILPKSKLLRHILIALLGIFMPVCECGNVPVARRLVSKGFRVSEAVTFLLAAPILNPITFISTIEAFKTEPSIAYVRMLAGFLIAVSIGLLTSLNKNEKELMTDGFVESCDHDHDQHEHSSKITEALEIFKTEFIAVTRMLVIGAFIAALSQTFIPRELIVSIGTNPFLSVIAMVILAFVISICSNVDAFFALSYANTFTSGALVAFLVFGPMIDIKILTMLKGTFKANFLLRLTILVTLLSILTGLLYNLFL
jgi:uncharacterized membrane protein YraQ (UPF0718 family)